MGTLTLDIKQSKNHTLAPIPAETAPMLYEPIKDLAGKVTVMLTKAATGSHHRKGIILKKRPKGSYEIRGTVQPGGNDTCREFVAQVDSKLDVKQVYSLWRNPPIRLKNKAVDPQLSKASIDAMRVAATALPLVPAFNLSAFWSYEIHFKEVLDCLTAVDVQDDLIDGDAFRTAVRIVLEMYGLKPTQLEHARSIMALVRKGCIESTGNTRPYPAYRLLATKPVASEKPETIKEEETVATIANLLGSEAPKGEFVLNRFWDKSIEALKKLDAYVTSSTTDGVVSKDALETCVRTVLTECGAEGTNKQVGTSLQALSLMGVVSVVLPKRLEYLWNGIKVDGGSQGGRHKNVRKKTIIEVVTVSVIIDALADKTTGDDGLLDKDVLNSTLGSLYSDKSGDKKASNSMISRAIHQLFVWGALVAKGPRGAKTFHLSRQVTSDATTRHVIAPKEDSFSDPLPLTEILETLVAEAKLHPCLTVHATVETISKTAACDEERALIVIDELTKNGYLLYNRGRDFHSYKVTTKAELYLSETRKKVTEAIADNHERLRAAINASAQPTALPEVETKEASPVAGQSPLERVKLALIKVEAEINAKRVAIDAAQATISTATASLNELTGDKQDLEKAKASLEELERTAEQMAQLTAKYTN
ncbi:MAG: hypothetical protein AAB613_01120 [Patescibacteria group bacterium]